MIVATAGHVDHGKTLLVKVLTGMDTDRLEEEKRRGLSINLGFAYLKTADHTIAFVDVPGHTRFINNMIAGINGIDLGMLVVAADDGPMPQTREHMDVLKLLGVTHLILVISKIDRVEKKEVDKVRKNALALFPEPGRVPVFEVDSPSQLGIADLAAYLDSEAGKLEAKSSAGYFRLSIDRAFHIKGSGLVVTGTVASGSVQSGNSLVMVPQNVSVRVRSLQVQEQDTQQASCGQRCALNISGDIEKDQIERGDWLVDTELKDTTMRFDARVSLLQHANSPLKHMSPVKLYIGAKRIAARLALLEQKKLFAGESTLAQLIVERAVHCCHHDRFLLRDDSESQLLGGGVVLDTRPIKGKRSSSGLQLLYAMEKMNARSALGALLFEFNQLVNLQQFCLLWNIRVDEQQAVLRIADYESKVDTIEIDTVPFVVANSCWQSILQCVRNELATATSMPGNQAGVTRKELYVKFSQQFPGLELELVLKHMQASGTISLTQGRVSLVRGEQQQLSKKQQQLWNEMEAYLSSCGLQVPVLGDMAKALGRDTSSILALSKVAVKLKWLIVVADRRAVLVKHIRQFADKAVLLTKKQSCFSVADFKNECSIGRNLAVEVLEYFDKIGFTLRKESGRVVLNQERVNTLMN